MYAIVNAYGHQRRIARGDVVWLEETDAEVGDKVVLDNVLVLSDGEKVTIGKPNVAGASVEAQVLRHVRDRKVKVFKFKRRKGMARRRGHRHDYTEARVLDVLLDGQPVEDKTPKPVEPEVAAKAAPQQNA
jgi:large subunit ribosomal protein L21